MASNASRLALGGLAGAAIGLAILLFLPRASDAPTAPVEQATAPAEAAPQDAVAGTGTAEVGTASDDAATATAAQTAPDTTQGADATPQADAPADESAEAEAKAEDTVAPEPQTPEVTTFYRQPGGFAVIAGTAAPNQTVRILLSFVPIEEVTADASGQFAATLLLDPSDQPRSLTLMADPDGAAIASTQAILVGPTIVETADAAPADQTPLVLGAVTPTAPVTDPTVSAADAPQSQPATEVATTGADTSGTPAETATIAEATPEEDPTEPGAQDATSLTAGADAAAPATEDSVADTSGAAAATTDPATETADAAPLAEDVQTAEADTPAEPAAAGTTEQAPQVIVADSDGVRVLPNSAAPTVLSDIALDTITYDPAGDVSIAGRAVGEGLVQVYIDNQPVTTSRIEAGAWRTDLPKVDTGIYTLRIDEIADDGTVVSRIETPFKREEPEAVAAVMAEETSADGFDVAVRTVQPGSTLWAIAREELGEGILYVAVYEANRDLIRNPDLIYPGQVFRIPEKEE